ncbi:MAG: SMUG2 DNA glycosylase family protein [Leptonema sp. (in: Bacteria)]|nr:SMUG2 DNA glycosylase family protein [Leptonema sp. (in: bacteria)]
MSNFLSDQVIKFNENLRYQGKLPSGFQVLNPFRDNPETMVVMRKFYENFYADSNQRLFVIGINPSRHGAGVTGVPFTDTKRLNQICGIEMKSAHTHEVSSVFLYDVIAAYGGATAFYSRFYVNSPFPLAIVRQTLKKGSWLNANYYDDAELFQNVKDYMIWSLRTQVSFGLETQKAFVLGKKNADFIKKLNKEANLFQELIVLEHPRYIQQYRSKQRTDFIEKYLNAFQ